jgi:hypothetical protein
VISKYFFGFSDVFPPVVGTAFRVRDSEDDDLLPPHRLSDIVLAKLWLQIYPAHTASADVVQEWIAADVVTRLEVTKFKGEGNLRINACIILDAVVVLLLSRRMYLQGHYER